MRTCVNTKRTAFDQIHESFIAVSIDKETKNVAQICKRFYASLITKELGLGNNDKINTCKEINGLSYDYIVNKNINDLSSKFGIKNGSIKNYRVPNMYWLPKFHETPSNPDLLYPVLSN